MKSLGDLAQQYMREMMGMNEPLEDQEQNWILSHLIEFARRSTDIDRMGELSVPTECRTAPTRPVRAGVDDGNEVF